MENNSSMTNNRKPQSQRATVLGVILIIFGGLYLAKQAGILDPAIWRVIFSWQMLLIALGFLSLSERQYAWGTLLIVVGGLFMYTRYTGHLLDFIWPVIIIAAGLVIIFYRPGNFRWSKGNQLRQDVSEAGMSDGTYINETAILGGNERIMHTSNFKGGTIVSILGGSDIDVTNCTLEPGTTVIVEMTSIMGGSTLRIPTDWNVVIDVTSILGGFSDKRYNTKVDPSKTLIIRGVSILGGGEIKN